MCLSKTKTKKKVHVSSKQKTEQLLIHDWLKPEESKLILTSQWKVVLHPFAFKLQAVLWLQSLLCQAI